MGSVAVYWMGAEDDPLAGRYVTALGRDLSWRLHRLYPSARVRSDPEHGALQVTGADPGTVRTLVRTSLLGPFAVPKQDPTYRALLRERFPNYPADRLDDLFSSEFHDESAIMRFLGLRSEEALDNLVARTKLDIIERDGVVGAYTTVIAAAMRVFHTYSPVKDRFY